jgi:xylulokinase
MILAVDVGTSALKAALFERSGAVVSRAAAPLTLLPDPDPVRREADVREWIRVLRRLTAELGAGGADRASGPAAGRIDAVVVSGQNPTLVPVSSDGEPLANAITWMDRRCVEESRIVAERRGSPCDPSFFLPKALWLLRHRPDVYGRARWLFSCPEYVSFVLTGEAVTFLPTPDYTRTVMWDAETVRSLGMDPGKFPPFLASGAEMGRVTAAGEAATGVPRGARVFAGAQDYIAALLGTATVAPGRACLRSGTSEGVNVCSAKRTDDARLMCVGHIAPDCWNVSGFISTSGKALEWFRNAMGGADAAWDDLFDDISRSPPGANRLLFLPYLSGERTPIWDPLARGAFVGLTLNHGRRDMTRAVVESVAYAIRDVVETIEAAGVEVRDLRITGGPSRSPVWNQLKADVTGRRLRVPAQRDSDLAGDACLALFGLGDYDSIAAASEATVRMGAVFEPDAARGRIYDGMFELYRAIYRGLKAVFAGLSGATGGQ